MNHQQLAEATFAIRRPSPVCQCCCENTHTNHSQCQCDHPLVRAINFDQTTDITQVLIRFHEDEDICFGAETTAFFSPFFHPKALVTLAEFMLSKSRWIVLVGLASYKGNYLAPAEHYGPWRGHMMAFAFEDGVVSDCTRKDAEKLVTWFQLDRM